MSITKNQIMKCGIIVAIAILALATILCFYNLGYQNGSKNPELSGLPECDYPVYVYAQGQGYWIGENSNLTPICVNHYGLPTAHLNKSSGVPIPAHPVNLEITSYSDNKVVETNVYTLQTNGRIGLATGSPFVVENNVTQYDLRIYSPTASTVRGTPGNGGDK